MACKYWFIRYRSWGNGTLPPQEHSKVIKIHPFEWQTKNIGDQYSGNDLLDYHQLSDDEVKIHLKESKARREKLRKDTFMNYPWLLNRQSKQN